MKYRAEIDGLRAIAVIPVILFHAGFTQFSGGFIGVDVFFVISGYLITSIILSEMNQGDFTLKHFYERRARRILPALFMVMLISLPLALIWLEPSDLQAFAKSLVAVSLFSSNILFWLESSYWGIASELKPLIHTWSLAVEEQFYVLFPLLLMLMWRYKKQWIVGTLVFLAVISICMAQWFAIQWPEAGFFLLPTRAWELLIGALLACGALSPKTSTVFNAKSEWIANVLSLIGLLMIGISIVQFDANTIHPSVNTLVPVLGTGLIIIFSSPDNWVGRFLGLKPLVGLGLISYSAYLWHQMLFAFARHKFISEPSAWVFIALAVLSLGLAFLTYQLIEKPFRKAGKISRNNIFRFSILSSLFFIIIGVLGYFNFEKISLVVTPEYLDRKVMIHDLKEQRNQAVLSGSCHYSKKGQFKKVDSFIKNWSCLGKDNATSKASKIAIYGDSHSADIAQALRLNGVEVFHVGGTGCPMMLHGRSFCQRLFNFFQLTASENSIETVLLSNRFRKHELTLPYLQELLNYWSKRFEQVYIFSPRVEFPYWQKKFLIYGLYEFQADFSSHDKFYHALSQISVPDNVIVLDSRKLHCEDISKCSGIDAKGNLLITDYGHMSKTGMRIFGDRLVSMLFGPAD